MPFTIRDATPTDLRAIVAIYNESIPGRLATADTERVSVESRQEWFLEHTPDKRPLWVAEKIVSADPDSIHGSDWMRLPYQEQTAADITGWLSFQSFYGRPAYHITAEISLYVAPEWRRKGVGRTLLREAVRRAPSFGLRSLVAYVFAHNEPSLRLLESFGFERWGLLPGIAEMDGVERDLVILGRRV